MKIIVSVVAVLGVFGLGYWAGRAEQPASDVRYTHFEFRKVDYRVVRAYWGWDATA